MKSSHISHSISINSPLVDIANDIAHKYLLRPFPSKTLSNGLLDYTEIRNKPIDTNTVHRTIHGYINACHLAALIPLIFEFYRKHFFAFIPEFQQQMIYANPDFIKKVQIVGLMRAAGRTQDSDSGCKFAEQGKIECMHYLETLGVSDKREREFFANAIVESDGNKVFQNMSLPGCLIADTTMMETIRDTIKKGLPITAFTFYNLLIQPIPAIIDEFIELCYHHAKVIKEHQGYLLSALVDNEGNPIVEWWPSIDDPSERRHNSKLFEKKIKKLEYSSDCFDTCFNDVNRGFQILNQQPKRMDEFIQESIQIQKNENLDRAEYINNFIIHIEKHLGHPMVHTVDEQTYLFRLNWNTVIHYLVDEKKIFSKNDFCPSKINQLSIVTKDNDEWYQFHFNTINQAENQLRLVKITLQKNHFLVKKAKITRFTIDGRPFFSFKLNKEQVQELRKYLEKDIDENALSKGIQEFITHYLEMVKAKKSNEVIEIIKNNPSYIKQATVDAVLYNNLEVTKSFIEKLGDKINDKYVKNDPAFPNQTLLIIACRTNYVTVEIIDYLISQGADINQACDNGRTPLAVAAYNGSLDKIRALINTGRVDPNIIMDNGHTALINALERGHKDVVKLLLTIPNININHKRQNGESALFIAVNKGFTEIVSLIFNFLNVDINAIRSSDNVSALEIAEKNGSKQIIELIKREKEIYKLEERGDVEQTREMFQVYAMNLNKSPSRSLYLKYLKSATNSNNTKLSITDIERDYIYARKIWSDVISETNIFNKNKIAKENIKKKVLERLNKLDLHGGAVDAIYEACVTYLIDMTTIVVTFDASFLKNGLDDFQLLNMWEKDNRNRANYTLNRNTAEEALFQHLSSNLKIQLLKNNFSRPRYAVLKLIGKNKVIEPTTRYGKSFLVIKDIEKLRLLTLPSDSLNYLTSTKTSYQPCTIDNLDIFLLQCDDSKLQAIIEMVFNNELPKSFDQNKDYFEVLLPALPIFGKSVEMIYIDPRECTVDNHVLETIKKENINLSNDPQNPYLSIRVEFLKSIVNNDSATVGNLLKKYPSLNKLIFDHNLHPINVAIRYGSMDVVKLFLANNLFILPSTESMHTLTGKSEIHFACTYNQPKLIEYFIDDINDLDIKDNNPLHFSASNPCVQTAKLLLDKNPDLIFKTSKIGETVLHYALKHKAKADYISFLIDRGANVNIKNIEGYTPLHVSIIHHSDKEVLSLLLSVVSDIHSQTTDEKHKWWTPLHFAIHVNNTIAVNELLKNDVNLERQSIDGKTALQFITKDTDPMICYNIIKKLIMTNDINNLKLVNNLIANFDINIRDVKGRTLFHHAVRQRNCRDSYIFAFLIDKQADVSLRDKERLTPLHNAIDSYLNHNDDNYLLIIKNILKNQTDSEAIVENGRICINFINNMKYDIISASKLLKIFLYHAIEINDSDFIDYLFNNKIDLSNSLFYIDNFSLLQDAILKRNSPRILEILLLQFSNANNQIKKLKDQLKDINLNDTCLHGINFDEINLQNSSLEQVDLEGANLQRASLRYAKLKNTNFKNANLAEADLRGCTLEVNRLIEASSLMNIQLDQEQLEYLSNDDQVKLKNKMKSDTIECINSQFEIEPTIELLLQIIKNPCHPLKFRRYLNTYANTDSYADVLIAGRWKLVNLLQKMPNDISLNLDDMDTLLMIAKLPVHSLEKTVGNFFTLNSSIEPSEEALTDLVMKMLYKKPIQSM